MADRWLRSTFDLPVQVGGWGSSPNWEPKMGTPWQIRDIPNGLFWIVNAGFGISDHLACLEMGPLNFADLFDMTIFDGSATVE